jgi:NADP-reducing hydrogenase subunit HndB
MGKRIASPEELKRLRDRFAAETALRAGPKDVQVTVHLGTCGIAAGARDVLLALAEELSQAGGEHVTLRQAGCAGLCEQEPMVTVTDRAGTPFRYGRLDRARVHEIVQEHVLAGRPVTAYLIADR